MTNINLFHPFFVVTVPRNRTGITDILHQVICLYQKGQTPLQYAVLGQERQTNGNKRLVGKFLQLLKVDDDLRSQRMHNLGRKVMFLEPYAVLPMSIKFSTVYSFNSDIFLSL